MLKKIVVCIGNSDVQVIECGCKSFNILKYSRLEFDEIASFIDTNKVKADILILPSYFKQKIITEGLPYISYFNIKQLISRINNQNRAFHYDIVEHFLISSKDSKFYYSFAFAKFEPSIIQFICKIKNKLNGVYLSDLEAINLLLTLNINCTNRFLILYTFPNNMVIVNVDRNNVINYIEKRSLEHTTLRSIAGNFIQCVDDILSSKEQFCSYLHIIVPARIKDVILNYDQIKLDRLALLTPYEASILLKIDDLVEKSEYFADILFSFKLIKSEKSYKCIPKCCKSYFIFKKYNKLINYLLYFFILYLFINTSVYQYFIHNANNNLSPLKNEYGRLKSDLRNFENELSEYDQRYKERINLYKFIHQSENFMINYIKNIYNFVDINQLNFYCCSKNFDKCNNIKINAIGMPKINKDLIQTKLENENEDFNVTLKETDDNILCIDIKNK